MNLRSSLYLIHLVLLLAGCATVKKSGSNDAQDLTLSALKFLDEYEIPFDLQFKNTWVGGLSGIDYDPAQNLYFIISDE
ncbi:hypothetical protein [Niabella ginsengisoli]|uniref:Uncharacterized protein n=1 Tax=Niabella ginsengisoli TaxID=522298 RepID=A0ABS9SL86_9BACT|nr:hypothetical protein [Niabella ginsengisoli]MCH5599139.1 hypothetical protein [Niabella ginsengisoli]